MRNDRTEISYRRMLQLQGTAMANANLPPDQPRPFQPAGIPDSVVLYKHCFDGYVSRDQMIPQGFSFMTSCFVLLLTIMGIARSVPTGDELSSRALTLLIGIAGLFALVAYTLDIHANASCKGRLRDLMVRMERREILTVPLADLEPIADDIAGYWHFIHHRKPTRFERGMRIIFRTVRLDVSATIMFKTAAIVYCIVWIGLTTC